MPKRKRGDEDYGHDDTNPSPYKERKLEASKDITRLESVLNDIYPNLKIISLKDGDPSDPVAANRSYIEIDARTITKEQRDHLQALFFETSMISTSDRGGILEIEVAKSALGTLPFELKSALDHQSGKQSDQEMQDQEMQDKQMQDKQMQPDEEPRDNPTDIKMG